MGDSIDVRQKFFDGLALWFKTQIPYDVILIADHQRIPAHRVILSAASQFFAAMFTNDFREKNQNEITLQDVNGACLKALIDCCYSGSIEINEGNMYEILLTASRLNFCQVELACYSSLSKILNASNCLNMWSVVHSPDSRNELTEAIIHCAGLNFDKIVHLEDFLLLNADQLLLLLQSDKLNVWSEEEVFNALVRWIDYDPSSRNTDIKKLMSAIRFIHLRPRFILETIGAFCSKFKCKKFMSNIMNYKFMPQTTEIKLRTSPPRLIVIGNDIDSSPEKRYSQIYCPISGEWKIFPEFTCQRKYFCSVIFDKKLFILGGFIEEGHPLKSVQAFDFTTKKLIEMEPMITGRDRFAAVVSHDCIYVAGGTNLKTVERFDLKSGKWTEIAPMAQDRKLHALVTLYGRIYAVGGIDRFGHRLNAVEYYDPCNELWQYSSSMIAQRSSHSAFAYAGRLYAIRGHLNQIIESYDPKTSRWTHVKKLTTPRYHFGFCLLNDCIFIAGGLDFNHNKQSTVLKINLKDFTQETVSDMHVSRSYCGLLEVPSYNANSLD